MTIVQKSFRYSVGRVLAPAADGRSFRNRTACRQTVHMFCTHLDKSICLLRQHSQICQYITAGASTRPTFNPVKPLFYCHLEHSPTITPIPLERNVSIMIKPRTLSGFMELLPGAAAADGAHYGHPAPHLFPLRLHAAGHPRHRGRPRSCWPRAAARPKSRSTASPRATAIWPCALT